jgi:hypothetical protein
MVGKERIDPSLADREAVSGSGAWNRVMDPIEPLLKREGLENPFRRSGAPSVHRNERAYDLSSGPTCSSAAR